MTDTTTLKPGDTVRFTFGCTDTELFGTLRRFTKDRQGRPAALIGVAGFPDWSHVEPLESLRPTKLENNLCSWLTARRLLAAPIPAQACNGNCSQGHTCTCDVEVSA